MMKRCRIQKSRFFLLFVFFVSQATVALSATLKTHVVQPGPSDGKDTYYGTVYTRQGAANFEFIQTGGWGDWYYGFLEFDLVNAPAAADVASATMHLYLRSNNVNNPGLQVHRVTSGWTESSITYSSAPSTTYYTDLPLTAASSFQSNSLIGWYAVDITSLYKDWQDGIVPNYGVNLHATYNSASQVYFWSSDYEEEPSLRPKLVIEYLGVPEPSGLGLVLASAFLFLLRR